MACSWRRPARFGLEVWLEVWPCFADELKWSCAPPPRAPHKRTPGRTWDLTDAWNGTVHVVVHCPHKFPPKGNFVIFRCCPPCE
eukprot:4163616-Prymnesium_polylepis.1